MPLLGSLAALRTALTSADRVGRVPDVLMSLPSSRASRECGLRSEWSAQRVNGNRELREIVLMCGVYNIKQYVTR